MLIDFFYSAVDFLRNPRIVRNAIEYLAVLRSCLLIRRTEADCGNQFENIHTYVMFIGIGRSGTSLTGALLDAHPRIIISRRATTLKYLYPLMFSREQIFSLLLRNSRKAARDGRIGGGGYSYAVPGQWQGKFESLEVIGDKSKSAQDVAWLTSNPALLDKLAQVVKIRIRMIHVIRNPYDTIATRSTRRMLSLEKIAREYFSHCDKLRELISRIESTNSFDVERVPMHFEDFLEDPELHLSRICGSLGVEAGADYLRDCLKIIRRNPHKSRHEVTWNPGLINDIQRQIEKVSFLRRYSFDD
jgi:hypothetical protein